MTETSLCPENNEQTAGSCTIPLPKGDENTTRLARRYARAFSHALKKKQYVVLCNIPVPVAKPIILGAWLAGLPVANINPLIPKAHLADVLSQLGTSLKIGNPECLYSLEDQGEWLSSDPEGAGDNNLFDRLQPPAGEEPLAPYEWNDNECAAVVFTSGSTGKPKGVCHSLGNMMRSAEHTIDYYSITSEDRILTLAPLHTSLGLLISNVSLMVGCQLLGFPKEPTLENTLDIFRNERPTIFITGPIFFRHLALLAGKLDDELSSIRLFLSSGAKLDRSSRIRLWEKHRVPVLDHYGLTETIFAIGEHADHYKPELDIIGKPPTGITVELTEVEGISDPELTVGQIRIHSPNLFLGYLGKSMERKKFLDTGDLGVRDTEGNISLKGRLDHGVKASSTLWLFPQALEQLLVNRSDVADALVHSEYDKYDRGVLHAKVVPANPETANGEWLEALRQDIKNELGQDYKDSDIEIASAIPRTALGKIIKD